MSEEVKVSIIIPVYNVEKFIKQCLESAINQSLEGIEIIVVNDGSTDQSGVIVNEYLRTVPHLQLIHQKNSGQSVARNKALHIAKGKYVYFLDSDDYIELFAMEELYMEAEKNNLDLILFDGKSFFDEDVKNKKNYNFNYQKNNEYPKILNGQNFFAELIHNKDYKCSPCLLFIRKNIIIQNDISFLEGIIHEDELFTLQLMLSCLRVKNMNKVYFHRRIRLGSTMTSSKVKFSFDSFNKVFIKMLELENTISINNEYVRTAILTKQGYIYGSIINKYCYMSIKEKRDSLKEMKKIKEICKQKKYFHQKQFFLFQISSEVYCILRKIYDKKFTINTINYFSS